MLSIVFEGWNLVKKYSRRNFGCFLFWLYYSATCPPLFSCSLSCIISCFRLFHFSHAYLIFAVLAIGWLNLLFHIACTNPDASIFNTLIDLPIVLLLSYWVCYPPLNSSQAQERLYFLFWPSHPHELDTPHTAIMFVIPGFTYILQQINNAIKGKFFNELLGCNGR